MRVIRGYASIDNSRVRVLKPCRFPNTAKCNRLWKLSRQRTLAAFNFNHHRQGYNCAGGSVHLLAKQCRPSFGQVSGIHHVRSFWGLLFHVSSLPKYLRYAYMIDNVVLLITGTLHGRDTHELLSRCHPLGVFDTLPALCVATNVEDLYQSVLIETPLGKPIVPKTSQKKKS